MQTFMPLPSVTESAQALDTQRLGKQIIEGGQIMRAILDPSYGWQNHPATKMWIQHPYSLYTYTEIMHSEWYVRRRKQHRALDNLDAWLDERDLWPSPDPWPEWFGDPDFHASHRSNLLRKDPSHYSQFGWSEPHDLPYIWPRCCAHD